MRAPGDLAIVPVDSIRDVLLRRQYDSRRHVIAAIQRMAEDSANRTHQRLQQPPNGFEDRPEHQSRLPSVFLSIVEPGRRDVAAKGNGRVHW